MGKLMSDFFMALVLVRMVLRVTLFSNGSLLILSFLGAFILVV
jgi:hypothetical protein